MKEIKMLVKDDLYWVKISDEAADYVNPNEEESKIALVKNNKALILSENIVLPLRWKHFSGQSRDYYSDELSSYSYDDYISPKCLCLFNATKEIEKITSSLEIKTLSFENVLKLEKMQNMFIKQKEIDRKARQKQIAEENKVYEIKRKKEEQEKADARAYYRELFK